MGWIPPKSAFVIRKQRSMTSAWMVCISQACCHFDLELAVAEKTKGFPSPYLQKNPTLPMKALPKHKSAPVARTTVRNHEADSFSLKWHKEPLGTNSKAPTEQVVSSPSSDSTNHVFGERGWRIPPYIIWNKCSLHRRRYNCDPGLRIRQAGI